MSIRMKIITAIAGLTLVAVLVPVSAGAYTGVPADFTFTKRLNTGSNNQDVVYLKIVLANEGCISGVANTTYFGVKTGVAVKCLKAKYSIGSGTTLVATLTNVKLNAILAGGVVAVCGNAVCEAGETATSCPADCTGVIVPTGAGLNVALAATNPASGTVILAQGLAPLAKFTFTNGDNAEVKITNFKVNRIGISLDATLANIYLFNGAVRLTDAASVSSGLVTFNDAAGLFTVPAGGSITITVAADLAALAGQTVGVAINASTSVTTNASSVKGTFPINGNLMTAATATGAGVAFASTTTPSTNTSLTPQNDYVVWQNSAVITTRAVDFTRIAFRQIGSVKITDLQNFRLYVDGVQVGSAVASLDANGYVTFDLSASPKRLEAGTRVIKLMADIIAGSSLNFKFRVSVSADANFVDTQYNVNTAPTTATTSGSFTVADVTSGVQTIASGTLTFAKKTDSPSGNIVNTASNAVLARYTLTAAGERVKVESLYVRIIFTNVSGTIAVDDDCAGSSAVCILPASMLLRNGMLLANGVQIGSTTAITPAAAGTLFSPGSSLIVEPGSPVTLEVRGDIYDATGTYNDIDATDTLQVRVVAGLSNAQGLVSLATVSTPSANTDSNVLTVKTGDLTLSKYTAYTTQTVTPPLTNFKMAHFTLTADTTEAVNVSTITMALDYVSAWTTNLYVKFGNEIAEVVKPTTTATNTWSVNRSLTAGQTVNVLVYGDISSSAICTSGNPCNVTGTITGTTVSSATSVGATGATSIAGQNLVTGTATLTPAVDGTTPLSMIVAGGQQVVAGKFKFTALYDSYTINELKFTIGTAANSSAINSVILKDGATPLATAYYDSGNSYFNITGLTVPVAANTNKVLTLVYDLSSTISSDNSNSQVDITPTLDYIKYSNSQGAPTTSNDNYATGKNLYVFSSIPTVTKVAVTTSILTNNTVNLYSWKIAADPKGPVVVKQVKFALNWTAAHTVYLYAFKLYKDGNDISSLVTITDEDGHDLTTSTAAQGANASSANVIIHWTTEDTISAGGSSTYILEATASGFASTANTPNSDIVSISMPADTTVNGSTIKYIVKSATDNIMQLATSAGGSAENANFIWSDNSAVSHASTTVTAGTTATSSGDWANGKLIQSLPLSSTTWMGP